MQFKIPCGEISLIEFQHDHTVSVILPYSNKGYITGCKDGVIRLFEDNDASHKCVATLASHEKPVTSLPWADNNSRNPTRNQQYRAVFEKGGTPFQIHFSNTPFVVIAMKYGESFQFTSWFLLVSLCLFQFASRLT